MRGIATMVLTLALCGIVGAQTSVSISGSNGSNRTGSFTGTESGTSLTGSFTATLGTGSVTFNDLSFDLLPEDPQAFPGNRYRARFTLTQAQATTLDVPWDDQDPPEWIVNVRVNGATDQSGNAGSPGNSGTLTPMRP